LRPGEEWAIFNPFGGVGDIARVSLRRKDSLIGRAAPRSRGQSAFDDGFQVSADLPVAYSRPPSRPCWCPRCNPRDVMLFNHSGPDVARPSAPPPSRATRCGGAFSERLCGWRGFARATAARGILLPQQSSRGIAKKKTSNREIRMRVPHRGLAAASPRAHLVFAASGSGKRLA